ncbi:DUF3987 domain-containing protein [Ktedonobacteria bacterium brp13]|nr:DUF3987 domain-containing protein [Ktedonobacteria bacterium brp13]
MVATLPKQSIDELARDYINSLARGVMPTSRPDLEQWENIIASLEIAFLKVERAGGDIPAAMHNVLATLYKTNPDLCDLMQPGPTIEDIEMPEESDIPPLPVQCQLDSSLARDAFPILDTYVEFSRKASPEGYDDFHPMVGMWMFSVVAARRVYLPMQLDRFYGNLMIGLFGKSSLFAKSLTAKTAKHVLNAAGLGHLVSLSRTSPSKLLSNMAGSRIPTDYEDWPAEKQEYFRKCLAMSAQKGLFFDELGKFIQAMLRKGSTTSDFADIFLELDGCPDVFGQDTQARNSEPIQKPYLALLGAMTPANLKENASAGADFWTDGFWGRFSFVAAPPGAYKDEALEPGDLPIPEELIQPLRDWHRRLGVPLCDITEIIDENNKKTGRYLIERQELPETACAIDHEAYQAWKRYRSALKKMIASFPHEDFASNYARLPETALRMAILMASLSGENNRITLKHWAKAQELAELLRKNLHELYRQVNCNDYQSETTKLEESILTKMHILKDKGVDGITVAQLKSRYLKNTSIKMLTDLMESMTKAGILKKDTTAHATKGKYFLLD